MSDMDKELSRTQCIEVPSFQLKEQKIRSVLRGFPARFFRLGQSQ